ncbi:hypothetical protein PVAG01_04736 [Phlyctema vagabunda]|uniref:Uncharacterized protein n=1 Tax=Phlyctema vagabunda TaxID=108571 RepID=A0ABR4PI23_9HELO
MNNTAVCATNDDNSFGPQVEGCIRSFDFTLTFENLILSVLPSAVFILIAPVRIFTLYKRQRKVAGRRFQTSKLLTIALFGILQSSLLMTLVTNRKQRTPSSIAAAVLGMLDAVVFLFLSHAEHGRNIRPSMLIGTFLLLTLLFDIVRLRTLWLIGQDTNVARLFTTSVVLKLGIMILEAKEKRSYLNDADRLRGPEELSGIFSQGVFFWVNQLVRAGYEKVLSLEDLYPLDDQLVAIRLNQKLMKSWEKSSGNTKYRLLFDTMRAFKWEVLAPILPRIILIGFTFCQPLLLNRFLEYLQDSEASDDIGYGLVGAYGLVYFGLAITTGFYYHRVYRFITIVRGALITAIYRKTTEISITALDNSAAVTLLSADVERIVEGFRSLHEFWANLIQVGIVTYLLQKELGAACVAPIVVAIVCAALTFGLSSTAGKKQEVWMKAIQERIGVTSAMLSSMKGVKMAGLIDKMTSLVQSLRVSEVNSAGRFRKLMVYAVTIAFVPIHLSPAITFAVFTIISQTSGTTLDTARMFTSITLMALLANPLSQVFQSVPSFIAAISCFTRIQRFLLSDTKSDHRLLINSVSATSLENVGEGIELQPVRNTAVPLDQYAFMIRSGTFGWLESEPILRDLDLSIETSKLTLLIGPVASGKSTLLKALLGETPSSKGFVYVATKEVAFCDQTPWLKNGTVQKNILGFSNFDAPWYSAVVHACGFKEDLATFPLRDQSLVGSKGITLSGGQKQRLAIARAVYSKKRVLFFDDVFSVNLLPSADHIVALDSSGQIVEQGTFEELSRSGGYVQSFRVKQGKPESSTAEVNATLPAFESNSSTLVDAMDEKTRQLGDLSVYWYYFKSVGWWTTSVLLFYQAVNAFTSSFPTVWLKWWADANNASPNADIGMYLGVYIAFQVSAVFALFLVAWQSFVPLIIKSGLKLHWETLRTVTAAPLALFATVDAGVLLNRFSQDIELIDGELPLAVLNFIASMFNCLTSGILIATAAFYIALVYPFIIVIFYFIQRFYLRTSRQLRFMDIEAKSPLYTQFIESLSGLSTIRAFDWQQNERDLNLQLLDSSQRPFYLLYMIQRWLTLVLSLITMVLALVVTGVAVKLRHSVSPGFTGVALMNVVVFGSNLESLVLYWTILETSIGAVSRVKSFSERTEPESRPGETTTPPEDWPQHGNIEFIKISASYKAAENKALDELSLSIRPGEKLGICGRSGSGKSTFILALFRMIEIDPGSILIDDIDISTLPRNDIRLRLNAISQEPYFIAGTIRLNLDPYEQSCDEDRIRALRKVSLWENGISDLAAEMDPESLSHGQRQLFCLARAILRKTRIVILDEATSSVDRKTDALMQEIIRDEFRTHTIIAVAHRLDTILDFDRVAVLDRGRLKECDEPTVLLNTEGSAFKELYETYASSKEDEQGTPSTGITVRI